MKKLTALALAAIMLLALCAGCAGGNDTATTSGTTAATQGGATQAGTTAAQTGAVTPARDDLTIIFNGKISNYDPYATTLSESYWLNSMLFDTLACYTDFQSTLELRLAKDYSVSDDGLQWTFNLKEGVTFHDGTPLTADDVKVSIEAAMASPFKGGGLTSIDRVEVTGPLQFVLHTHEYNAETLGLFDTLYIVPGGMYTELGAEGFAEKLIGTGPFVLESIDEATSNIVLRANESYWDGASALKTINVRVITENSTRIVALEKGEVDFNRIYNTDFNTLSKNSGLTITELPSFNYGFLIFNMNQAPCDNKGFRQAIAHALDYETINAVAQGGVGSTAGSVFYKEAYGYDVPEVKSYSYDPEKAKTMLAEAGIATPLDLGVVSVIPAQKDVLELIQQNLAAVGVNIQIEQVEAATYVGNLYGGNFTISYMPAAGGGSTIASAYKSFFLTGGDTNFSGYSNAEVDAAIQGMLTRRDDSVMNDLVYQALSNIQEDIPYLNLFHANQMCVAHNGLNVAIGSPQVPYSFRNFSWN